MRIYVPARRHPARMLAPAFLFLACLGSGPAAHADSSPSSASTEGISVFRAKNTSVAVSGGVATAINSCLTDASDGVIQMQRSACRQVASAGNAVDGGAITVYRSKNVSIIVSGGAATAINRCVNDASDGVVQDQQNACDQAAAAGNIVTVDSITVSTSKNVYITVSGGSATAINECVNNASDAVQQDQQNACVQMASSGNTTEVGDINISASKNITVDITGGLALDINSCVNNAFGGTAVTQGDTCTKVAAVGNSTSVGRIQLQTSKNVTIKVDGTTVFTVHKGRVQSKDATAP
jgi:hypothetical protein